MVAAHSARDAMPYDDPPPPDGPWLGLAALLVLALVVLALVVAHEAQLRP